MKPAVINLAILLSVLVAATANAASPTSPVSAPVDFARDVRPIFNKNCVGCHGGVKRAGKISFIYRDVVVATNAADEKVIHPGDPEHSEFIRRITTTDEEDRMPPAEHGPRLSEKEIALLREWVRQGAAWKEHWAWIKPVAPAVPKISKPKWVRQPLDAFVLAKLDSEKLKPSAEADRIQWLRRVSFDLTGLPPTPEEAKAFVADKSPQAHERVVDRLLASPRFGERWASPWLDAARYADSMGFEKDPLRTVWPYRDWVIRALNDGMPFDQFTVKQLAGDLLPEASLDDQIATTFHRNTQLNTEGGTDDEEYRLAAVIDRVNTTWEVWQGTTMRCVQCHSHPYEPIKHEEFYRSLALFNTTRDWDLPDDSPTLRVPLSETDFTRARQLDQSISKLRREEFDARGRLFNTSNGWIALAPDRATATKGTQLVIQTNQAAGNEIRTVGTVATFSQFTIEIPLPEHLSRLSALRIQVLPDDPDKARLTPEKGFILTQLRAVLLANSGLSGEDGSTNEVPSTNSLPGEIKFVHCFGDEAEPAQDDDAAVRADKSGWGANPRLTEVRRAVFVPAESTEITPGSRLKLIVSHEQGANDSAALVARRVRLDATASEDWIRFVQSRQFKDGRKELARLRKERDAISNVKVPVMREQETAFRRPTAVFERGNWLAKGETVKPGVPALFKSAQGTDPDDRLALARWLVSPENPLTARVTVNRIWSELFGFGLVETVEDFGSSGPPPVNQALLDQLALRFQNELGWSLKKLLREVVLSATYRQDGRVTRALEARDPQNRLLARGPRTRLSSEMVRDQALAVSGLLSDKMFGPPVMPPQPDGIWDIVYSGAKWETAKGEDRYRRALYTFLRRTAAYPSYLTFDSPSREVCVTRRIKTNTPLQALVTLNDPVYVECAVALAGRMRREGGADLRKQISSGYELATGRAPTKEALRALQELHKTSLARYQADPDLAGKLAGTPEESALALVANAVLNLDDSLTK
ncbi:MAG TPA: PSD1 and planctomycete cytochrome C domain-containing protein [Verrucomicrobiae bacterium]|nr:PSD1 and planctomycete cytochrome C domain-containing protein [Verrucomicrobiae bacterium]